MTSQRKTTSELNTLHQTWHPFFVSIHGLLSGNGAFWQISFVFGWQWIKTIIPRSFWGYHLLSCYLGLFLFALLKSARTAGHTEERLYNSPEHGYKSSWDPYGYWFAWCCDQMIKWGMKRSRGVCQPLPCH